MIPTACTYALCSLAHFRPAIGGAVNYQQGVWV
jgi:hypothetical protein